MTPCDGAVEEEALVESVEAGVWVTTSDLRNAGRLSKAY